MNNKHDEIKDLLKASRKMLSNNFINETIEIRKKYGIISEQMEDEKYSDSEEDTDEEDIISPGNITKKINVTKSAEDKIEDTVNPKKDKKQAYRISGGILVFHGKDKRDLELTTDDKTAFQETMDEFSQEVSDMADFNKLNVFENNVEWSGKIIDFDIDFFFSIGEENGIYINGEMIRTDEKFLEIINKLKNFYEKFKAKWAKVLSQRKKTKK
jgi:hypothetical protein